MTDQKKYGDKLLFDNGTFRYKLFGEKDFRTPEMFVAPLLHIQSPVDRTGTYKGKVNYELMDKIPDTVGFNKSIEQILLERAQEIVSIGKPIDVYWSGGIDSTALLIALLMVVERKNQITVKLSKESIDENPPFYEQYVKKLNHKMFDVYFNRDRSSDNITVTGDLGNQLFGHTKVGAYKDNPWKEIFEKKYTISTASSGKYHNTVVNALLTSQTVRNSVMEKIELQIKKSPVEIKTIFDFYWWMQFSLKWQEMIFKYFRNSDCLFTPEEFHNLKPFYRSDDFQRWSIVNHDLKIKDTWNTFKYPMKEFIYKFNGDSDYLKNKETVASAHPDRSSDEVMNSFEKRLKLIRSGKTFSAVDTNFNNITSPEVKKNINEMQHFKRDFGDEYILLPDPEL